MLTQPNWIDQTRWKEVIKAIPARVLWLVWKLLSFQGVVFATATALVYFGKLDSYAWLITGVVLVFGRYALDIIKEVKK